MEGAGKMWGQPGRNLGRPGYRSRSGIWIAVLKRKEKFRDSSYIGSNIVLLIVDDNSQWFGKKSIDVKIAPQERRIVIKKLGRRCFHLFFYLLLDTFKNIIRKLRIAREEINEPQLFSGAKVPCLGVPGCGSMGSSQIRILIGKEAGGAVIIVCDLID